MGYKNKAHKLLLHVVPIFMCWELWKNMCGYRYRGKQSNIAREYLVIKDVNLLLKLVFPSIQWPGSWKELVLLSKYSYIKVVPMKWCKPPG